VEGWKEVREREGGLEKEVRERKKLQEERCWRKGWERSRQEGGMSERGRFAHCAPFLPRTLDPQVSSWQSAADQAATVAEKAQQQSRLMEAQLRDASSSLRAKEIECEGQRQLLAAAQKLAEDLQAVLRRRCVWEHLCVRERGSERG
jgi:hypothetical protein